MLAHGGGIAAAEGSTSNDVRTGRFEPTGALTMRQRAFVDHFVTNGSRQTKAAELAGYSCPTTDAYRLLRLPHVQAAIRKQRTSTIERGATVGVQWMLDALEDKTLPGAVRFQCARWLAEAGGEGLSARRASLGPVADKEPHEMDARELQAFINACAAARQALEQERDRMTIAGDCIDLAFDSDATEV